MLLDKFDLIDRKILIELDKNARITHTALGKKIKVSKETVKYRINNLEKKGIIRSYSTLINLSKIGATMFRLYFRLNNVSPQIEQEIYSYLNDNKNIVILYSTNGPYHVALGAIFKDCWEFQKFWVNFKTKFKPYLGPSKFSIMTFYNELSRIYISPKLSSVKKSFVIVDNSPAQKLDRVCFEILNLLSANARMTLSEISHKTNVSMVTIRKKYKFLIDKKIISGFRPILNLQKLGIEYYKVDLYLSGYANFSKIKSYILSNPNVVYSEETTSTCDFEFDVEVENFSKFTQIMDSFKERFPNDIKDYSYYSLVKTYKMQFWHSLFD